MALSAIYSATVLEHNRAPRNFGPLAGATLRGSGRNASCGDQVHMALRLDAAGRIDACAFEGESCAICTAAASILSELAIGRDLAAIEAMQSDLRALMAGAPAERERLGALAVFDELAAHPARQRCALLPFDALCRAMGGRESFRF
ncbi:MAG: Fe-S cluster assembly sulfur transfer protein SufU [Lysobacterales bacterium]